MDPVSIATIATAILTPLSPYFVKMGEGMASQLGKGLAEKASALLETISKNLVKIVSAEEVEGTIAVLDSSHDSQARLSQLIIVRAEKDQEFANDLATQIVGIRNLILNCLQTRFVTRDLKKLYFNLGFGWDDLAGTGTPNSEKAIALIEEMWVSDKIPTLIRTMFDVRPDLRC